MLGCSKNMKLNRFDQITKIKQILNSTLKPNFEVPSEYKTINSPI
jgi:hypothetical protein